MKKNRFKKWSALLVAAVMGSVSLSGCAKSQMSAGESQTSMAKSGAESTAESTAAADNKEFSYPVKTDETLTYWMELNANVSANYSNMGETNFSKKLQEQTGVKIEYQHPAVGQTTEQFNLLLSNKVLPDIIEYSWVDYSGGPEKAIKDGVILPLNDVIDKYCPNLKAYLAEHPEIDKMIKTDDGTYYCFPFIRGGDLLLSYMGPMLREDWLKELNLEVPKTIDEWEVVLKAFKEKKGAASPFIYWYSSQDLTNNNPFAYAYGVNRRFFIGDDKKIHFGAVEDGYKEYLMLMNKWMKEGLIDVDLATLTNDQVAAKITNGTSGASFAWCGSGLGNWTKAGQATDPNYVLVPAPYPTLDKSKPKMGQRDNNYVSMGSAAITTSCKNVELAARLLDYGYGEAGHVLYNFGEENVSYTMEDGMPKFTDIVLNNPDLSITHAMAGYIRANYNGPFVQDVEYIKQYYVLDEQKEAVALWADTDMANHLLPPISPTADESKEMSQIMNEINTYRDEYTLKFILGTASFEEWDTYVNGIKNMGLDRVLEIQEAALARYNAR